MKVSVWSSTHQKWVFLHFHKPAELQLASCLLIPPVLSLFPLVSCTKGGHTENPGHHRGVRGKIMDLQSQNFQLQCPNGLLTDTTQKETSIRTENQYYLTVLGYTDRHRTPAFPFTLFARSHFYLKGGMTTGNIHSQTIIQRTSKYTIPYTNGNSASQVPKEKNTAFNFSLLTYPLIFSHKTLHNHILELQATVTPDKCPCSTWNYLSQSRCPRTAGLLQLPPKLSSS